MLLSHFGRGLAMWKSLILNEPYLTYYTKITGLRKCATRVATNASRSVGFIHVMSAQCLCGWCRELETSGSILLGFSPTPVQ